MHQIGPLYFHLRSRFMNNEPSYLMLPTSHDPKTIRLLLLHAALIIVCQQQYPSFCSLEHSDIAMKKDKYHHLAWTSSDLRTHTCKFSVKYWPSIAVVQNLTNEIKSPRHWTAVASGYIASGNDCLLPPIGHGRSMWCLIVGGGWWYYHGPIIQI